MSVSIESLFSRQRFQGGPSILFLILYAPLGLVLLTVRVFISLQLCIASLILPTGSIIRKFVLRVLFTVMGVVVREKDVQNRDNKSRVLISNHITPFDHLVVSLVYPCVSVSVQNLPAPISTILCYKDLGVSRGREVFKNNIHTYLSNSDSIPLLLHPEGSTTNGKVALMKYGSWAFEFDNSALVLGIKVYRLPILPISPSVLGSSWAADLFFALFSPVTVYTIKYIGKLTKEIEEPSDIFASRIQKETAAALRLQATNHNVSDKVEYIKRLAREEAAASNPLLNPEVHTMSVRVKEVLPYLPLDIIKRDIVRTRNVDVTITNFLEGNIPEAIPSASFESSPSHTASSDNVIREPPSSSPNISLNSSTTSTIFAGDINTQDLNMAAKSFGKSADERMLSFQERKSLLIEKARQKYLEKKGLALPVNKC